MRSWSGWCSCWCEEKRPAVALLPAPGFYRSAFLSTKCMPVCGTLCSHALIYPDCFLFPWVVTASRVCGVWSVIDEGQA